MSASLTRALQSDHQRRQVAKQEASDLCACAIVAVLVAGVLIGTLLSAAGVL